MLDKADVMPSVSQSRQFDVLRTANSMAQEGTRGWVQPCLLGQPTHRVLTTGRLKEEMRLINKAMLNTLNLFAPQARQGRTQHKHGFDRCMETAAMQLRQYALGQSDIPGLLHTGLEEVSGVLRDFSHFSAMAQTACRLQGLADPVLLPHLLGLAMVRYKIESYWQDEVGQEPNDAGFLSHDEIAAACELKLTSLRNAVSRGELSQSEAGLVPIPQALDWMLTRQRCLFLKLARNLPSRQINGKMASLWLERQPTASEVKTISRLRLKLWRLGEQGTLIAVNTGVRQCILTLPFVPPAIDSHDVLITDRSHDKAADLLRKGLGVPGSAPIWQIRLKGREAFESFVSQWL
jgi:hypothetical protein